MTKKREGQASMKHAANGKVIGLDSRHPGFSLDRVRAALEGRFDAALLTDDEREYFDDAFGEVLTIQGANFWARFDRSVNTDL